MPPIIKITDQNDLIETQSFPYAKFPFEKFNPVQSRLIDIYDKDCNCIVASQTSSGKTICAETFLSHEIRKKGKKGIYLAPLRSLAKEKIDDWSNKLHHFSDLKIAICTGDYRLTPERKKELEEADLILMTTEMLSARCRNYTSENNKFLQSIGTLILDEAHILTSANRGHHIEVGIMKFAEIVPDARLIFLSATMPNVSEVGEWLSYALNGKETYVLESKYRPCPLSIHFELYHQENNYDENEKSKIFSAVSILESYPNDKFLVFTHTKKTGLYLKDHLQKKGIDCEFHFADLNFNKRIEIEEKFKSDSKFRVLIATSTLAAGINCPARRVILVGVHRGLDEVEDYEIRQMVGRAGRPAYDLRGDAYILLPNVNTDLYKDKLKKQKPITSRLLDQSFGVFKNLAFHLVGEIYREKVKTLDDVHNWYERTLAMFQAQELEDDIVDKTVSSLLKCGAIFSKDGEFKATSIGKISSLFYFSPFDVSDLKKNLDYLFHNNKEEDEFWLSVALGNLDTNRMNIVSKSEKESIDSFAKKIEQKKCFVGKINSAAVKAAYCYYTCLVGRVNDDFLGFTRTLQMDFPRLNQIAKTLDAMAGKWDKKGFFEDLPVRITYGVKKELVPLCKIENIGKVKAQKLWNSGIKSIFAMASNPSKVSMALNVSMKKAQEYCDSAKKLL